MSVLTRNEIIKLVKKGKIKIEPFAKESIGPASYDLHLGNIFRVFKKIKGVVTLDENVDYKKLSRLINVKKSIILKPGETILGVSAEKITLPPDICGWLEGRSCFGRLGLTVHITAGFNHPGMDCVEVLEITNMGPMDLELVPGIAICQMIFDKCVGTARYHGKFHWQKNP